MSEGDFVYVVTWSESLYVFGDYYDAQAFAARCADTPPISEEPLLGQGFLKAIDKELPPGKVKTGIRT